jgi:leucyl-tRNA synthetase
LGHSASVHLESWPTFDESMTREDTATVVVQVNGKVRDRLRVGVGASEAEVRQLALKSEAVTRHFGGKPPKKFIFVPNRMLSIVV